MNYKNEGLTIPLYIQTDGRWAFNSMALPDDRFRDYGCLVTSITNIYNIYYGMRLTPGEMNQKIKDLKMYSGLRNPSLEQYYHSFLMTDDFLKELKLVKKEVRDCVDDKLYYCRVEVKRSNGTFIGHFTNLFQIAGELFIFDVFDGSFKRVSRGMITNIYEVSKL